MTLSPSFQHHRAGLAGWLLSAALISCSPAPGASDSGSQSQPAQALAHPGQPVRLNDLSVVLEPAELKSQVGLDFAPERAADGGVLVLIRFKISNLSNKPVSAGSLPDIKLIDDKGTEYAADAGKTGSYAMANKLDSKLFSDLNPGITVKDARVFEVSKTAFDPATWTAEIGDQRVALK